MIVSITERQTYKRCRRMWDYSSKYRRNLSRVGFSAPELELGGLVHRALAQWIIEPDASLELLFLQQTNMRMEEAKEKYRVVVGMPMSDVEEEPLLDVIKLGCAMMRNYQQHHGSPIPSHMKFASAEQEIVVPIPGTEHICTKCLGLDDTHTIAKKANPKCEECTGTGQAYHHISATLDGLLQDNKDRLYVLEHKTFHPRYRPTMDDLRRADQFTGYCWVVEQLHIGPVVGVAYDGMAKQEKPAKTGQYTKLENLFLRTTITKTPEEVEEWGRNLVLEVIEMASNPPIYPNIPWTGCGDCSFQDLCNAELMGMSPENIIRSNYTSRQDVKVQGIANG